MMTLDHVATILTLHAVAYNTKRLMAILAAPGTACCMEQGAEVVVNDLPDAGAWRGQGGVEEIVALRGGR